MSEWIVLAGGKGTRSEDPSKPKILQKVGPRTLLELTLEQLVQAGATKVVLSLSYKSDDVIKYLNSASKSLPLLIDVVVDEGTGPVNALKYSATKITAPQFGIILGDTLISAPVRKFMGEFQHSDSDLAVVVRQSSHLWDSDGVQLNNSGEIEQTFTKGSSINEFLGQIWAASGILFSKKSAIQILDSKKSDIAGAFFDAGESLSIRAIKSSFYHRDVGTAERLARVRKDYESGVLDLSPYRERPALFIDRDGTLLPDIPEGRRAVDASDLLEPILSLLILAKQLSIPTFLVTNQPQCAKGFITEQDVYKTHNQLQRILVGKGAWLDDITFCPHHPERGHEGEVWNLKVDCDCRKPGTKMIEDLARIHSIRVSHSIFIGDSATDRLLSERLGLEYFDALDSSLFLKVSRALQKLRIR